MRIGIPFTTTEELSSSAMQQILEELLVFTDVMICTTFIMIPCMQEDLLVIGTFCPGTFKIRKSQLLFSFLVVEGVWSALLPQCCSQVCCILQQIGDILCWSSGLIRNKSNVLHNWAKKKKIACFSHGRVAISILCHSEIVNFPRYFFS